LSQPTPPPQPESLRLDDAQPLVTDAILVQVPPRRGGGQRETRPSEAYRLVMAALGAVSQWAGIKWKNTYSPDGEPLAVVLIPGAQFGERQGKTTLDAENV